MSAHMMKSVAWVVGLLAMGVAGPVQAATITYFHNDFAGSPIAATDASGQVIWRESYRPYGERLTNVATSSANKLWFTSRRQDAESGLVYMGARYYDPVMGRFISTDPVQFQEGNLHSFNRYAYANNNPYRYTDPDGRAAATIVAVGAGAILVGGGYSSMSADQKRAVVDGLAWVGRNTWMGELAVVVSGILNSESSAQEQAKNGQTGENNPYNGPVQNPVVVVDSKGNAIPVGKGQQVAASPNGDYQQVIGSDGKPTGDRLDRGGHRGQKDPRARDPHAHRPGVTTEDGNNHLPIN